MASAGRTQGWEKKSCVGIFTHVPCPVSPHIMSTHTRQLHVAWASSRYGHTMSLQSCSTLCNPPGSSVHGILQARILEWVAISSSRKYSQPRDQICVSCLLHWQGDSLPLGLPGKQWPLLYGNQGSEGKFPERTRQKP